MMDFKKVSSAVIIVTLWPSHALLPYIPDSKSSVLFQDRYFMVGRLRVICSKCTTTIYAYSAIQVSLAHSSFPTRQYIMLKVGTSVSISTAHIPNSPLQTESY